MGSEEAILYSYDLATLPSIIPAFASKKDLILCDEVRLRVFFASLSFLFSKSKDLILCDEVQGSGTVIYFLLIETEDAGSCRGMAACWAGPARILRGRAVVT